jgi:iron complex transport system permease protein
VAILVMLSGLVGDGFLSKIGYLGEGAVTVAAVVGGLSVMAIIVALSRHVNSNVTLLIIGLMIGYIAGSLIGVLKYFADEEEVRSYVLWGLGSFSRVSGDSVWHFALLSLLIQPIAWLQVKPMNLLLLGEEYATNLGLNCRRARLLIILSSGIQTAVVTAFCGPILFLGLAVPHLCRGLFRTSDHRLLMPSCLLMGASLALFCNLLSRLPGMDGVLPVNSVTALVGAPVVVSVLKFIHRS